MKKTIFFLFAMSWLMFSACDKETLVENLDANIESGKAYVLGETAFFDVFKVIDKAVRDTNLWTSGSVNIDGALVSLLPGDTAILVDYGATNVICPDGNERRGAIRVSLDGDYLLDQAELGINLENYYFNNNLLEGTQTAKNVFSLGNYDVEFEVIGGKVTEPSGKVFNWATTRTLRWLEGMTTPEDISDDKVAILAGSTIVGDVVGGNSYTVQVVNNLEYGRDCEWISKGILSITIPGLPVETGTVDFGNGECDAKVTFLFGGSSIPYMMN